MPWQPDENDIAVIGFACRFPGAGDAAGFWANLREGTESVRPFTDEELRGLGVPEELLARPDYVKVGAALDDVTGFDHAFWGYAPREAATLDPQQRLFLETAWHAMEHAGYAPGAADTGLVGVYAGTGLSTYLLFNLLGQPGVTGLDEQLTMLGNDKDFLASRVSYHLDLRGPSIAVQTGCSSSLVAAHLACDGLLGYQCDIALAGGVSVVLPQRTGYQHIPGSTASASGHCRTFDADADGSVFGSGVGVVVLKRMPEAVQAGDTIYAVIKGSAVNNDGAHRVGFTAPSVDGQAEVILRAQQIANVTADTISYVEAHGTGTILGDPVELAALTRAFRHSTDRAGYCAIGSVKTNIGHLDAAAGVASLIKTTLALCHRQIPPSLNFDQPNPQIDFGATPFYVSEKLADWPPGPAPRRAGVSAFGFGGTNAHLVLEEAPPPPPPAGAAGPQLLVLSARSESALDAMTERLADHLRTAPDYELADIAHTLQRGRPELSHRRALACQNRAEAVGLLEAGHRSRVRTGRPHSAERQVDFLLAGLGDHYPSMAQDLYQGEPVFRSVVDHCAAVLQPLIGTDIRSVLYPETGAAQDRAGTVDLRAMLDGATAQATIQQTALAHPALFVTEYALARQWMAWGIHPSAMIGHSLGEYVAATLAGVFALEDALLLVARRAQLIESLPPGGMLAVAMPADDIRPLLGDALFVALVNGPALTVVAGGPGELGALRDRLARDQIDARPLPVQHAFHSPLMAPVAGPITELARALTLSAPQIPFVSNVSGTWITPEQVTDPEYWGRHSTSPVQFAAGLQALRAGRDHALLEIGPGQSLSALAAEHTAAQSGEVAEPVILPSLRPSYDHRQSDAVRLRDVLGQLWVAGCRADWAAVHAPARPRRTALPGYPFERSRCWVDPAPPGTVPAAPETGRRAAADTWFWEPVWRSAPLPPACPGRQLPPGGQWLLLADSRGLAGRLARRLVEADQTVTLVRPGRGFAREPGCFRMDPAQPADYRALRTALDAAGRRPRHIVHLWTHSVADPGLAETLGFHALIELSRAFLDTDSPAETGLWVVTDRLAMIESADRVVPAKALMLGALHCIPQEYADVEAYCIDLPATAAAADHLLELIAERPAERLIGYRGNRRWIPDFAPLTLPGHGTPLREGGVYVITGGTGTVGLDLADHLTGTAGAQVVLIGRTPLPPPGDWDGWLARGGQDGTDGAAATRRKIARLRALADRGAKVLLLAADVAQPGQLSAALEQVRQQFGAVHGIIHAAGLAGPAAFLPVADSDRARSEAVVRARMGGAAALAEALRDQQAPDFVLLLSSNAALLGGLGTAAYSASNAYLDALAEQQHQQAGTRWVSVNLEEWLQDGPASPPVTSFTQYGVTAADGFRALRRIVETGRGSRTALITGDLAERLDRWIRHPQAARRSRGGSGAARIPRPAVSAEFSPPRDDLERDIAELWQDMLGIDGIGRDDSFFELGGHSLLATQIVTRAQAGFQADLSLLSLLGSPTVAGFATRVREQRDAGQAAVAAPIIPVPREGMPPLSYAQRGLWILDHLAPDNPFYNIPDVVRIDGPLRVGTLRRSLNDIVARHEVLRTGFVAVAGEPAQRITPELDVALPCTDLSSLDPDEREKRWRELAMAEAAAPFDLSRPPLLRASVLRLGSTDHILLLTMHHSVADGWSSGVLVRELSTGYAVHSGAQADPPGPLPIQYADFASWQREQLRGEAREQLLDYWRAQLDGAPPLVEFPLDRPRPPVQSFRGAACPIALPAGLVARLQQLAGAAHCTLFMVLVAAFNCLLHQYSGANDIVLGTPIAGRIRAELEDLIGVFVNMVPLRTRIAPGCTFSQLLDQVRDVTLGVYAHQELPFELLVESLRPPRSLSHAQIFQTVFVLQNAPLPPLELGGLRMSQVPMPTSTATFDLLVTLRETGDGAAGVIEYATDLFDAASISRIARHYVTLLERVTEQPDGLIDELDPMPAAERRQVLGPWAHGGQLAIGRPSLPELLASQAARHPGRPALYLAGDLKPALTLGDLDARANQVAQYLHTRGIGADCRIAVCADRAPATIVLLLGIMKAGAAYVPLDPAYPAERLGYMLADCHADLTVIQREYVLQIGGGDGAPVLLDQLWAGCATLPSTPVAHRISPADAAYVLYTSGSTGEPKGVVGLHGGMVNRLQWMWTAFPFAPDEVLCQKTSLSFLDSFWEIYGPLCRGVPVVVIPHEVLLDPAWLVDVLAAHQVTRIVLVPSLLRLLLDCVPDAAARLPRLRFWVTSGEALPAELASRFLAALPGRVLLNLYGASEVSADVTYHAVTPADLARQSVPIGRPIAGSTVYLLDHKLNPVPPGVAGEVYVGGAQLARGYLGRPDLTAERFLPDPFADPPGGLLYRTGDLARFGPDGTIHYAGRDDHQVKVRGFRVELSEVETALTGHPAIHQAVVGADEDTLVAYLVMAADLDGEASDRELRQFLQSRLPHFMIPGSFVRCAGLPLTPSGKIDRAALARMSWPRAAAIPAVAPRDDAERVVAGIWAQVLDRSNVGGVHDDFFEAGGYSLLATRFVAEVREAFGAELPVADFFENPTVAWVVEALRRDPVHGSEIDQRAAVLRKVAELSDDEVQALLGGIARSQGGQS